MQLQLLKNFREGGITYKRLISTGKPTTDIPYQSLCFCNPGVSQAFCTMFHKDQSSYSTLKFGEHYQYPVEVLAFEVILLAGILFSAFECNDAE